METLPLIAGVGIVLLFLSKNKDTTSSNKPKESTLGKIDLSKGKEVGLGKLNCLETQFKDKDGNCKFFWIDGETDNLVNQKLDLLLVDYKGLSWDKMCADRKVNTGNVEFFPNPNSLIIVKKLIVDLWSPAITTKMLPPNAKSPDFVKTIWKRVTAIYFAKVCGLI
jgi:hypothetical protein